MRLEQIRSDWTTLGTFDPLWAVLLPSNRRHGSWDASTFLATGRAEVGAALEHLDDLRLPRPQERALDFGCGAGRLTIALADHVESVVGVDISPPMLARARELDVDHRCEFVENDQPDLSIFDDAEFDLVYSSLVLQHLPAELASAYLAEMLRVLKPGGVIIVQLATAPDRSVKGLLVRVLPMRMIRFAQRHVLRYPAPMDMHPMPRSDIEAIAEAHGARVLDAVDDPMYGGNWRYTRYYLTRP